LDQVVFIIIITIMMLIYHYRWGHTLAHLTEAVRYKAEGREFDSQWCHLNFSLT
jgi:hypothetical protein